MITNAANKLMDEIQRLRREKESIATYSAVSYASTDDIMHKEAFNRNTQIASEYAKMHTLVCTALHRVEAEMKETLSDKSV